MNLNVHERFIDFDKDLDCLDNLMARIMMLYVSQLVSPCLDFTMATQVQEIILVH